MPIVPSDAANVNFFPACEATFPLKNIANTAGVWYNENAVYYTIYSRLWRRDRRAFPEREGSSRLWGSERWLPSFDRYDLSSQAAGIDDFALENTTGVGFRSIANLQVLDHICGNIDRPAA